MNSPCVALILAVAASVASWVNVPGGSWDATRTFAEMRSRLEPYVTQAAVREHKQLAPWSSYTFQYQGQEAAGQQFVLINAFCTPPPKDVKTQFVLVLDGGPCFFRVKYDPSKKALFELEFNGDG
jgi:hypothetical protein